MANVGIPVQISLKTRMNQDGQTETTELIVFGKYYEKANTSFLIYDEVTDDGKVHTIIKYKEETVQIIRRGTVNMRLAFRKKERLGGTFQTKAGTLLLQTETDSIDFHWDQKNKSGIIDVNYHFFMEQMEVGYYQLSFTFKEEHQS